jgi:thiol-disulfide isomerase/thioredoxin
MLTPWNTVMKGMRRGELRFLRLVLGLVACTVCVQIRVAPASDAPQAGDVVLLDFNASWCGPCRAMAPLVQGVERSGWPVRHIDVDQEPDLVRRFGVTGVPCYVLLVRGHEQGRIDGATTQQELEQLLSKALPPRGGVQPMPQAKASDVAGVPLQTTAASDALTIGTPPPSRTTEIAVITPADSQSVAGPFAQASVPAARAAREPVAPAVTNDALVTPPAELQEKLLAATARLQVQDPEGLSRGTGTIIDCRQGEALILTCAHIFRDSGGEGRISVDLFGGSETRGLAGQLVSWDLDRDIALVSVFTDTRFPAARVPGPDCVLAVGRQVASVGCNGGADPTVHFSQITAVNKYLGPANLQVAGQPVPGRSGGGLFLLDGSLIGVCNAADPEDGEGLYAALQAVHEQLDEAGLSFVYRATYPSQGSPPVASQPPAMPESMPSVAFDRRDRTDAVPTASIAESPSAAAAPAAEASSALSPGEVALLKHVRQHQGQAEVICIVRPHGAESRSEVFVLSAAGSDFVDHLSQAHQGGRVMASTPSRPDIASAPGLSSPGQGSP